jgi:15-cis-phytoene synthase
VDLTEAYRECERITWSQARNFAYGIRLLPPAKRRGLAAIYAFARRIDDIGDGTMPAGQKIADLEQARRAVLDLGAAKPPGAPEPPGPAKPSGAAKPPGTDSPADPVLIALAGVQRDFPVPLEAFSELIDGCIADVRGTSYQTFDDLLWYCRCVAGSIGRLSLGIFGTRQNARHAAELADSLGVALQITNILRDIREDYDSGRVYLPAEDLAKFDIDSALLGGDDPPQTPPAHGGEPSPPYPPGRPPVSLWDPSALAGWTRLIEFEAERARDWYATGLRLLPMLDRRSAACTGAMAGIYRRLLERIAAQPEAVLHGRMSLSGREKGMVAVRALAGRNP